MLMQLIHRLVDLDRLRGAFNWKDGAVYFPTSMFPPTHPIHCLSYHGWWVSLLTSLLRGLPPPNLGTWALWSPKSGLNIPSEPQRRLALFCGLGGWAFIFWSNLINFGSSGSKVVWLIAKYDSNYRGTREISDLPEISSVCTSQSWGSWSMGGGSAMCADIHTNVHVCRSRWNVSGGNVVLPLSSITGRGRLSCQLSVFRGLCLLEKLSRSTFSRKGLSGRQRWWWLEKEASSFRRLSPEGGRGVNLVFDRAPAHDY